MDAELFWRAKEQFLSALGEAREERQTRLREIERTDPRLAAEVRALLAAHEEPDTFFERGARAALPEVEQDLCTAVSGLRIGPYRVLRELGRGGMGAVYLAERDDATFPQTVAIKLIKRGMDTDEIVRRFVLERRILAALVHPAIARLLDGGSTADGRPYFVMEAIEGRPITAWVEEHGTGLEGRLRLFLKVAAAVQFAHQNLVVHRDLKPANILIDAWGEPKLLDFGIAKLLEPSLAEGAAAWTAAGERPMTPDYASPEQAAGGLVTTATDVWGLGVLLYELLVGQTPAAAARRLGEGWAERPPSQVVLAADGAGRRLWARRLSGDLDAIVGKALERDPRRRYNTAAELAEEVERHLASQPVRARRSTFPYRLGRALWRHKLAAAFGLAVVLFSVAVSVQALALARQRDRAEQQRRKAAGLAEFLAGMFLAADPSRSRGMDLSVREVLATGGRLLLTPRAEAPRWSPLDTAGLSGDPESRAHLLRVVGDVSANLGDYGLSEELLSRAVEVGERQGGREADLATAESLTLLAHVARLQSDFARSRELHERALALKRRWLGPRALEMVRDWLGLGLLSHAAGSPARAEEHFRRALTVSREGGEPGRRWVAESLTNLGLLAADQGKLETARRRLRLSLELHRRILGDDDPETVRVLANLASVLYRRGEAGQAEELYHEVVALRRRLLGSDHPDLAKALISLAVTEYALEKLGPAAATLREALAIRRRLGLAPDADEAAALSNLAAVQFARGELAEAATLYRQAEVLLGQLPGDHRDALATVRLGLEAVRASRRLGP